MVFFNVVVIHRLEETLFWLDVVMDDFEVSVTGSIVGQKACQLLVKRGHRLHGQIGGQVSRGDAGQQCQGLFQSDAFYGGSRMLPSDGKQGQLLLGAIDQRPGLPQTQ